MTVPVMEKKRYGTDFGYRCPEAAQAAVGQKNPNAAGDVPSYNYHLFGTGLIHMRSPALY
jgi:hypothetical protein